MATKSTVRVRMVEPSYKHDAGEVVTLDADTAARLIANGHARPTTDAQAEKVEKAVEAIQADATSETQTVSV